MRNPKIIELAELLGRSVGAVSYKLANFARLDPTLQSRGIRGLPHGARGEEEIWREFATDGEKLAYESEKLLAERTRTPIEKFAEIDESELPAEGIDRERLVKSRVNQHFFRVAVLAAYNFRCCVSGLTVRPLLVASHIVPWSLDTKNRMNPRNGLCLNALHDRAFDRGLMTITADFRVTNERYIETGQQNGRGANELAVAIRRKSAHSAEEVSPGCGAPRLSSQTLERLKKERP